MWASSNSIQLPSSRALFPLHRVPVPCTSPAYVTDISKILIITTSIMCDVHMLWFCCWWLWWWCGDDDDAYCNANDDGCRMNNRVDPWKGRWARATKAWCSWTNGQTIILIISLVIMIIIILIIMNIVIIILLGAPGQTVTPLYWSFTCDEHLQHIFHCSTMLSYFLRASDDKTIRHIDFNIWSIKSVQKLRSPNCTCCLIVNHSYCECEWKILRKVDPTIVPT